MIPRGPRHETMIPNARSVHQVGREQFGGQNWSPGIVSDVGLKFPHVRR